MIATVLLYSFLVVATLQIVYYLFFSVFAFAKNKKQNEKEILPISIILCAKNEAKNLKKHIPLLLNQKHAKFELVLINDASKDKTLAVMEYYQKRHHNIKIVNVENNKNFWGNKKYALTLGIKAAKYEHLLFTDADCYPISDYWISLMSQHFSSKKSIVLGYGKYLKTKFSFVNLLVRYETLLTAIQYFSYALLRNPYMAVGRNFAYTKTEFFKVKGFIKHIQIRSGDDDLFVQDAATKKNTTICFDSESFTVSMAPKSLHDWFRQKRRHISTANHYKVYHQILLSVFFISKFLFWILLPLAFALCSFYWVLSVSVGYLFVSYIVVGFAAYKLKETQTLLALPFLELFLVLSQFAIFSTNLIYKPTHWK